MFITTMTYEMHVTNFFLKLMTHFYIIVNRVWCCSQSGKNQAQMEQVVVNGSESHLVVVDNPNLLQKKMSAIRLAGPAKLQVLFPFFYFVG